jgi:Flp pilus assembly protein TadD
MLRYWPAHLALAALVLAVYGQTVRHEFLNFDDQLVVTQNPRVQGGLSLDSVRWAFTTGHFANWTPLAWISHQLDGSLFGPEAGGRHLTSVLLHLGGVLLLFDALRALTGAWGPSFLVAALYAVHPLHVESVAWIAERKGILSTFFWMLALRVYAAMQVGRVETDDAPGESEIRRFYSWVGLTFIMILGLLAKQMVVTLPVSLVLLDLWPLKRWDGTPRGLGRLVAEKWPLFAAGAVFSVVAYLRQSEGGAVSSLVELPMQYRLTNAVYSAATYLRRLVWPSDLSVFYPHPLDSLSTLAVAASAATLALGTVAAIVLARRLPFLAVGWFWYLATLLPVCGLVPVGRHGMADRYTDIPLVGLYIAAAWTLRAAADRLGVGGKARCAVAAGAITLAAVAGFVQTSYWRTSRTLFERVLAVDPDNYMALNQLGALAMASGDMEEAERLFEASLAVDPSFPVARTNRGRILLRRNQTDEALAEFRLASELGDPLAAFEAARIEGSRGRIDEALELCRTGLAARPEDPDGLGLLGFFHLTQGRGVEAEAAFEQALEAAPDFADAHRHLAVLRLRRGRIDEAREHFAIASALDERIVEQVQKIAEGSPEPILLDIYAACLAQVGRFADAARTAALAIERAEQTGQTSLIPDLKLRLQRYRSATPPDQGETTPD